MPPSQSEPEAGEKARASAVSEKVSGAQTIARAVSLLRAIARGSSGGRRLKDLAAALGLPQPTVHRILRALVQEGLVAQDSSHGLYRIGPLAFEFGLASTWQSELIGICRPHTARLAAVSGDTAYLSLRSGVDTVCLDRAEGNYPIRAVTIEVGGRLPLGVGTGGVALLAALDDDEINQVLSATVRDLQFHNGLTEAEVRARISETRQNGLADINDKPVSGVRGIGIAVPAHDGRPFLALALAAISERIPDRRVPELRALLDDTARAISTALEGRGTVRLDGVPRKPLVQTEQAAGARGVTPVAARQTRIWKRKSP